MHPLDRRRQSLQALRDGVDVLIIGGGITGAGVALDAVTRGYSLGLVERADYASGTSSRSTKLVHGGLRYLPQRQFHLVREALHERDRLRRLAPHLVRPLPFVVPIYRGMRRPLGLRIPRLLTPLAPLGIRLGLLGYDLLARGDLPHRSLSADDAARTIPGLRMEGLRGAFLYYDAQTDDVRLTHAVLATARRHGAVTLNYAEAVAVERGRPMRVAVVDRLSGERLNVPARHVVNATGVWADRVAALTGPPPFRFVHSKGVHLVLDRTDLLAGAALVVPETDDGRLAFLVRWGGRMVLGTTDTAYDEDLDAPRVSPADTAYLLTHVNRYVRPPVVPSDLTGAYAGLRPLVRRSDARPANLSRDYQVVDHPEGPVSIIGGKLTTYRRMAQDAVDVLVRRDGRNTASRTEDLLLSDAEDYPGARDRIIQAAGPHGVSVESIDHLYGAYGTGALRVIDLIGREPHLSRRLIADLPVLAAEVVLACREEEAVMLSDWLSVRSRLEILDRGHGLGCVQDAAALMARELGWSDDERARQISRVRAWANGQTGRSSSSDVRT